MKRNYKIFIFILFISCFTTISFFTFDKPVNASSLPQSTITVNVNSIETTYDKLAKTLFASVSCPQATDETVYEYKWYKKNTNNNFDLLPTVTNNLSLTYCNDSGEYKVVVSCIIDEQQYIGEKIASVNIKPIQINATIENKTIKVGESPLDLTYTLDKNPLTGDNLDIILEREAGIVAGNYAITGSFNNPNYDVIFTNGIYSILTTEFRNKVNTVDTVIVLSNHGLNADYKLIVSEKNIRDYKNILIPNSDNNAEIKFVYDTKLLNGNENVVSDHDLTIRLYIPNNLRNVPNLKVYNLVDDENLANVNFVREGNYFIFTASTLMKYVIVGDVMINWFAIIISVIVLSLIGLAMFWFFKIHKTKVRYFINDKQRFVDYFKYNEYITIPNLLGRYQWYEDRLCTKPIFNLQMKFKPIKIYGKITKKSK